MSRSRKEGSPDTAFRDIKELLDRASSVRTRAGAEAPATRWPPKSA